MNSLAAAGLAIIAMFMVLIASRRVSALVALLLLPIPFALMLGHGADLGQMTVDGVKQVAPTAFLIGFAILFFATMIDAGLFAPLGARIVRLCGDDPVKAVVGAGILSICVAFSGDGISTTLIVGAAMLPVFERLRLRRVVLACLIGQAVAIQNLSPWAGPTPRVAAALGVDAAQIYIAILPSVIAGSLALIAISWRLGVVERRRLARDEGKCENGPEPSIAMHDGEDAARPHLLLFNMALTAAVFAMLISGTGPAMLLFAGAYAIGVMVNYPSLAEQRKRFAAHGSNVAELIALLFAAGIFTGIMQGTGMIDALAQGVIRGLPAGLGDRLGPVVAALSAPMTFFLPNDAFFFGAMPIAAEAGRDFGYTTLDMARASVLGQSLHVLSPLVPGVYVFCSILGVELGEYQRFAIRWALLIVAITIAVALISGAVPISGGA